jgi:hypothetical protein
LHRGQRPVQRMVPVEHEEPYEARRDRRVGW